MGSLYNGDWSDYGLYKGYNTATTVLSMFIQIDTSTDVWNVDTYGDSGCFTVSPELVIIIFHQDH